jgi:hypothetical protein
VAYDRLISCSGNKKYATINGIRGFSVVYMMKSGEATDINDSILASGWATKLSLESSQWA